MLVTSDSRRTMATSLGAGVAIDVEAVERAGIQEAAVLYLEGYLLDSPGTYAARERAVEIAKSAGVAVALSLSDPFLVDRYDGLLNEVIDAEVDLLFANEEEARRLTGADDLAGALDALSRPGLIAAVTLGAKGAVLLHGNERASVEAPAGRRAWTTRPAPATCSPRASCTASSGAHRWRRLAGWVPSPPARSSLTSGRSLGCHCAIWR